MSNEHTQNYSDAHIWNAMELETFALQNICHFHYLECHF